MQFALNINDALDDIELATGSISNTNVVEPFSTGVLAVDLMYFGRLSGGVFLTAFGKEQAGKSTYNNEVLAYRTAVLVLERRRNPKLFQPALLSYDYEGSCDYSEGGLFMNTLRKYVPDVTYEEVFGIGSLGKWELPPLLRHHKLSEMEVLFDSIHRLNKQLPDIMVLEGEKFMVYTPEQIKEKPNLKNGCDADLFKKTKKAWHILPDGFAIPFQVLVAADSFPAMLPKSADEDEANKQMALLAREFAKQIPRARGGMRSSRVSLFGVNQFRERPGVIHGCFHGSSPVLMADGTKMRIRDVVEQKHPGPVLSRDMETGEVVAKPIVSWFDNGETNQWLKVTFDRNMEVRSHTDDIYATTTPMFVTPNHMIALADGTEVPAGKLKVGQAVQHVSSKPRLTWLQKQLVLGEVLSYPGCLWNFGESDDAISLPFVGALDEQFEWLTAVMGDVLFSPAETAPLYEDWVSRISAEQGDDDAPRFSQTAFDALELPGFAAWVVERLANGALDLSDYTLTDAEKIVDVLNGKFGGVSLHRYNKGRGLGEGWCAQISDDLLNTLLPYMAEPPRVALSKEQRLLLGSKTAELLVQSNAAPREFFTYTGLVRSVHSAWLTDLPAGYGLNRYDIEVADTHHYCVSGVVVHNSPEYEPCGTALRFASDARLRVSAVSPLSETVKSFGKPIKPGSPLVAEPSVLYPGRDDHYSYIKLVSAKNKLGGVDKVEVTLRLWRNNGKDFGLGFDPVFDCFQTMRMLGMIPPGTQRNRLKFVNAFGLEHATKAMTWEQFKVLASTPMTKKADVEAVLDAVGLTQMPAFRLPEKLRSGILDGSLVERFRNNLTGFTTEEETEVESSDEGVDYRDVAKAEGGGFAGV